MEALHKLEDMIEGWLKPVPHLPNAWRKWLAENAWWLTLIGVVLSVFAVFGLLSAASIFGATSGLYGSVIYNAVVETHGGLWLTSIYVSLILLVITVIVEAMAISPLKALSKKGWDLMFLAYVIGVISGLVGAILNIDILSLIWTAIGAAIGAYVLFEVRGHFKKA
jgi:uncharacterized membrane protein YhaH (DUF805 family)